mmetsp:Transcript_9730/g.9814  ORF Transcript_9730/g.9814 Transcript_9730/m.9814 type:complete len:101 (-) Transcript_9730:421-723(-)
MSDITTIVQSNDVVVFSSSWCGFCQQAISALKAGGYPCTVVEVTEPLRDALYQATGKTSVPSVWIKGKYVGGCNDGPEPWMGICKLIRNGEIVKHLSGTS